MSLLSATSGRRGAGPQAKLTSASDLDDLLQMLAMGPTAAGVSVSRRSALRQASVLTSVLAVAEAVGQLPVAVFRRLPDGQRERARDHWLDQLIGTRGKPNGWMTSQELRETGTLHAATGGDWFALKNRVRSGRVVELLPIHPDRVRVDQGEDFRIAYTVQTASGPKVFGADQIFHLRGPSEDGLRGLDRIALGRDTIGLALAQDAHAGALFRNAARVGGVLEHPKRLDEETAKRIKASFEEIYAGVENAFKTAVLEEGMTFKPTTQSGEDAQLLDSRKAQRSIVSGIWRVPPHMTGDLDKATFSNIENLSLQYLIYTLTTWIVRWELALELQLLSEAERGSLFVKFNTAALMRADAKTRAEFYNKALAGTWMNPNEVRELEDLPPRAGGDEFFNPNITPDQGGNGGGDGGQR